MADVSKSVSSYSSLYSEEVKCLAPGAHLLGKRRARPDTQAGDTSLALHAGPVFPGLLGPGPATSAWRVLTTPQRDVWRCLDRRGCSRCRNQRTAKTQMQNRHPTPPPAHGSAYSKSLHIPRHAIVTTGPPKNTHTQERGRRGVDAIVLLDVRSRPSEISNCFLKVFKINK